MRATIKDVARMANVSISTVSRVLNSPNTVAESKRKRVIEVIRKLDYQPNALARGLIHKKTSTYGVLIPDIDNPYFAGLIRGMEDASKEHGFNLIICNTDREKNRMVSYLEMLREKQVDGVVFASDPVYPDYYEALHRSQIPVVLASTHSLEHNLPSVKINDEQAAFDAVNYLIRLGHRQIGMISLPLSDPIAGLPRYEGFMRAVRTNGLEQLQQYVAFAVETFEHAYAAAGDLFEKYPGITAVFNASDIFALGTMSYLHEHGYKVPDRVSVIGFDNIRFSEMCIPKLTTVAQPTYQIGYRAIEKLGELIEKGEVSQLREILPHQLIIRHSTQSKD